MKSEICFPDGLPDGLEDDVFEYGIAFTEFVAWTIHKFLLSGAMRNEIHFDTSVRVK